MRTFEFSAIGVVESPFKEKFGTPRQSGLVPSSRSVIRILPKFQPELSLQGLAGFSHIWVLFVFHLNQNKKFCSRVSPPRMMGESVGIFSTRSPHRPNPIGQSLVKLVEVGNDRIIVSGLDLVDGTPVLDIKPYLVETECQPEAQTGWVNENIFPSKEVETSNQFESQVMESFLRTDEVSRFLKLVKETLSLDPRPVLFKASKVSGETKYFKEKYTVRLENFDVTFSFQSDSVVRLESLKRFFK